ncbi:chromosome segregation protein SMC [bacterium]|nr:chromosome segregation protein SMC [bacterium]
MRLLRLEASGFKSFCDKVSINFVQNGISIVVGPNGCGKSNIVDAIRWALGEQSAKHLRGTAMEDFIFNGSSVRQPVSMAQVTLVFSNEEHDTLSKYSEFTEISVSRRLYRNGESQYLINKTPCRLTDVRELFMDTGIGGKGYSIIEQGKIDQIITSRAEDRRFIIDEAAGIVKFKTKRKEAERKFAASKQNLMRVEDVLAELIRQEETLVVQVEKAEDYLAAKSRLERLQNCIAATRWYQLNEQAIRNDNNRVTNEQQQQDLKTSLSGIEANEATLSLEIERKTRELDDFRKTIQDLKEQVIKSEGKLQSNKITLENLDEWESKNAEEIELLDKQIKTIEFQLETYHTESKSLEKEIAEKSQLLETLREKEETSDSDLSNQKLRLKNLQRNEVDIITAVAGEQNQLSQLQERSGETSDKSLQLLQQLETIELKEKEVQAQSKQLSTKLEEKQEEREQCLETIQSFTDQKEEKEEILNELNRKIKSVNQDISQMENRLQSLEELVLSHEEYDVATKKVFDYMEKNRSSAEKLGFLGSLAELIDIPEDIDNRSLAFLNRYFNLLVFSSVDQLEAIIKLAKKENFEQVQLSFLDLLPSKKTGKDKTGASLVCKPELNLTIPFIESFKSIDLPIYQLSKDKLEKAEGLIDPEASIMTVGKIFLVGHPGKSNLAESFMKRRNEISALKGKLEKISSEQESLESILDQETEIQEEIVRSLNSAQKKKAELDLEIVALEKESDSKTIETQRLANEKKGLRNEIDHIDQSSRQFIEKIEKLKKSIQDNQQKLDTIQKVCGDLQAQIEQTEQTREKTTQDLHQLRVSLASLNEKLQSNHTNIERLTKDVSERKSRKEEIDVRSGDTIEKRRSILSSLSNIEAELPKLLESVGEQEKMEKDLGNHIEVNRTRQMELKEEIKTTVQNLEALKDKNHKLEVKLAQLKQEAKNIEDNLFLESSLKPEDLLRTFDANQFNIDKESEVIAGLKKKIGGMDDINLAAKSEYDTLKERLDFLSTQSNDLKQSIEALENSINKINQESRKRFRTAFKLINEQFSILFPQLFGGGEAYLRLTDESDLLESGVEIIAQPPGKKLQNMTLLSGGEKALTAISLIFAVFMIKPSPFCLLDEVDAPLDDANNVRFNKHVQAMTANSQFIIITHNKKTMEIGDSLFGITMEEPGISKVVSVDFANFDADSLQKAG